MDEQKIDFYLYKCKLVKVIDGDTIDVDIDLGFDVVLKNQRIRLNGIDTPESRTSDKIEKKYGLLAKKFNINILYKEMKEKNFIILKTIKDSEGKFGRILGDFIINDTSLVQTLIENHLGVPYCGQSKDEIKELHLKNRDFL